MLQKEVLQFTLMRLGHTQFSGVLRLSAQFEAKKGYGTSHNLTGGEITDDNETKSIDRFKNRSEAGRTLWRVLEQGRHSIVRATLLSGGHWNIRHCSAAWAYRGCSLSAAYQNRSFIPSRQTSYQEAEKAHIPMLLPDLSGKGLCQLWKGAPLCWNSMMTC